MPWVGSGDADACARCIVRIEGCVDGSGGVTVGVLDRLCANSWTVHLRRATRETSQSRRTVSTRRGDELVLWIVSREVCALRSRESEKGFYQFEGIRELYLR